MDTTEYFDTLMKNYNSAYEVASRARARGFEPKGEVEIKIAQDLASRTEGIIGVRGIAEMIKNASKGQPKEELAFQIAKEICTGSMYSEYAPVKKIELAVRVGLALLTDSVVVAPTEGIQSVALFRNPDNSDYITVVYAGPIRSAGGTPVALSVALADYSRRFFNIGVYQPTQEEIERYVEEVELYDVRTRLQYKPGEEDLRFIVSNCPICIDGLPTEEVEVSIHRDMRRIDANGREVRVPNRLRGGMPLVLCEGMAQKAKKVMKILKVVGLDWSWLNNIIRVEKVEKSGKARGKESTFLDELVAGRPILAFPGYMGGLRLRYGRSRLTGIAAMGFNPATMILTMGFVAVGTQLKMEQPRKGCVITPVDSIEGPFVKLKSGETLRVNDAETARRLRDDVAEILTVGDILITYGDFKNANAALLPSSYVEEFWDAQLREKDQSVVVDNAKLDFRGAYELSLKYSIPIHPKFLFDFQALRKEELQELAGAVLEKSNIKTAKKGLFQIEKLKMESDGNTKRYLELLNVTHKLDGTKIVLEGDYAQSLVASLGFASGEKGSLKIEGVVEKLLKSAESESLQMINEVAPFRVMKRATYIGARVGRPEKARERLMKPAPNVLYPIGGYGGKERNITKAYMIDMKKLGNRKFSAEIARYTCKNCKRVLETPYCYDCELPAPVERVCNNCGKKTASRICENCGMETTASEEREVDVTKVISSSMRFLNASRLPSVVKGVKGLTNRDKVVEPIEKGILRSMHDVFTFKDGTARFDATDVPITHFYPKEVGVGVGRLRELGYEMDYSGEELKSDDQLVELRHQDVILSRRGGEYLLRVSNFIDDLLEKVYKLGRFYNAEKMEGLTGHMVITLSPHTSCGVLGRIMGFTDANVGFAHPYMISSRRRNCDGDEDTTMLLLDGLVNFSRSYLPTNIGATMDAPLILTPRVLPEEVDDEVHVMETTTSLPLEFYNKTLEYASTSEVNVENVKERLKRGEERFRGLKFTHLASINAISDSPKKTLYSTLKTMEEKVDAEFLLMNRIRAVDSKDAAKKLILSHFIPDLIGNLHTFSKQKFRCSSCNAKYRRVPLSGKCTRDDGKLLLTVSKGGIEKYLELAIRLADVYELDPYIRQRLKLVKDEINNLFGEEEGLDKRQFNLSRFI